MLLRSSLLIVILTSLNHRSLACISSAPRQYSAPSYPAYQYGAPAGVRAAGASNVESGLPISSNGGGTSSSFSHYLLGARVQLAEFSSKGYNDEGGGPVAAGRDLQCDFDSRPCCWANVPTPDDQIDWKTASGAPDSPLLQNASLDGNYLVAFASGAAPSDEAQLASCSIACASSPIRVRVRHWQSSNILLQVCQRESFPNSVNFNPLLNCQEFPLVNDVAQKELVLPKASLIDIVFVASNFVNENGDIAVLDNIEISYESDAAECGPETGLSSSINGNTAGDDSVGGNDLRASPGGGGFGGGSPALGSDGGLETISGGVDNHFNGANAGQLETISGSSGGDGVIERSSFAGVSKLAGKLDGSGSAKAFGVSGFTGNDRLEAVIGGENSGSAGSDESSNGGSSAASSSVSSSASAASSAVSSSSRSSSSFITNTEETNSVVAAIRACQTSKCTFEDGTTCSYKDSYETETSTTRGLTTKFQVVKGQFMNRVTGIREGVEGNYYAAAFLFPRERASLKVDVAALPADHRLRFQYYESTHGVQLKGCCDTIDSCPFGTDKFVSVSDRMWKFGSFSCPRGTEKIIFLCENTRTNQGACALDDIQVVDNVENVTAEDRPLC